LELNPLEVFDTRTELWENVLHVCIGLLSIGLAARGTGGFVALAGFIYMLVGPVMTVHGLLRGKKRRRLGASLTASAARAAALPGHTKEPIVEASQIADATSRT
jgi:hypothetical protein